MNSTNTLPKKDGPAETLRSGGLFGALATWRRHEKRHAMIVLGEISASLEQRDRAKENADRALHEVRKRADEMPAMLEKWERLAAFNSQAAADGKSRRQTPKGVCVHRGIAEGIRMVLADLS